jgi:plastocyanin
MLTTLPRRIAILAAVAALAIALSACGGSGSKAGASGAAGKSDTISIKNETFTPGPATAGSTVTVENNDSVTHTVTADDGKSFDVQIKAGQTATFTAPAAGTYKFHCKIHSNMHGTLTVT